MYHYSSTIAWMLLLPWVPRGSTLGKKIWVCRSSMISTYSACLSLFIKSLCGEFWEFLFISKMTWITPWAELTLLYRSRYRKEAPGSRCRYRCDMFLSGGSLRSSQRRCRLLRHRDHVCYTYVSGVYPNAQYRIYAEYTLEKRILNRSLDPLVLKRSSKPSQLWIGKYLQ